jgi:hypothetical protein
MSTSPEIATNVATGIGNVRTTSVDTAHLEHASEMAALRDRFIFYG